MGLRCSLCQLCACMVWGRRVSFLVSLAAVRAEGQEPFTLFGGDDAWGPCTPAI